MPGSLDIGTRRDRTGIGVQDTGLHGRLPVRTGRRPDIMIIVISPAAGGVDWRLRNAEDDEFLGAINSRTRADTSTGRRTQVSESLSICESVMWLMVLRSTSHDSSPEPARRSDVSPTSAAPALHTS